MRTDLLMPLNMADSSECVGAGGDADAVLEEDDDGGSAGSARFASDDVDDDGDRNVRLEFVREAVARGGGVGGVAVVVRGGGGEGRARWLRRR